MHNIDVEFTKVIVSFENTIMRRKNCTLCKVVLNTHVKFVTFISSRHANT